jgi:antitoxin component YwqK of YwqJK toxin-antitoxin module
MKYTCSFILVLSLSTYAFSQESKPVKIFLDEEFYKCNQDAASFYRMTLYDVDTIYHGRMKTYFMSGKIYSDIEYFHGKEEGSWTWWYENGQKSKECFYEDGNFHMKNAWLEDGTQIVKDGTGHYKAFHSSTKKLVSEGNYNHGVKDGLWSIWFKKGQPEQTGNYTDGDFEVINFWDKDGNLMVKDGTGSFKDMYYETDKIDAEGSYKDGKRVGTWKWYFLNGKIAGIASYVEGKLDGYRVIYYPNGKKSFEGSYKDGEREGEAKWWYWNGNKLEEGKFEEGSYILDKAWKIDGTLTVNGGSGYYYNWNTCGKLLSEGKYINNVEDSTWTWYYPNGQKRQESFYKDGEMEVLNFWSEDGKQTVAGGNGRFIQYYYSGGIEVQGEYKNKLRTNEWTWYYETGNKMEFADYTEGKLTGRLYKWYQDGNKKSEITYDSSSRKQKEISYYKNGKSEEEGIYKNDKYYTLNCWTKDGAQTVINGNGAFVSYYENDKIRAKGNFINSKKEGLWQGWYENGNLKFTENLSHGKLNGQTNSFYENGVKKSVRHYKDGNESGKAEWFDENGLKEVTGKYINDERDGLWTYFKEGTRSNVEFYKKGKLLYSIIKFYDNGEVLYQTVEKKPEPILGYKAMFEKLEERTANINPKILNDTIDGTILVGFVIGNDGIIWKPFIYEGNISPYYNQDAIDLVSTYCKIWKPGYQNGKAVNTLYIVPVNFNKLNKTRNSFETSILQNGKALNPVDNLVTLEKSGFEINVKFKQPNENFVSLIATNDISLYNKALQDVPMTNILDYATTMASSYLNPSNELIISNDACMGLFYEDSLKSRFNSVIINKELIVGNFKVDSVTISSENLKQTKSTTYNINTLSLKQYPYKDLYLIFFTRKSYSDNFYYLDYYRQCIHIRFQ